MGARGAIGDLRRNNIPARKSPCRRTRPARWYIIKAQVPNTSKALPLLRVISKPERSDKKGSSNLEEQQRV
ncbi:MAG: hypothetical protein ACKN87_00990, partial [Microcystis aeruginosa]